MTRKLIGLGAAALLVIAACGEGGPTGPSTPTLELTTTALDPAAPTVEYYATLEVSGGSGGYTWSITAGDLPPGMVLSGGAGVIAGRTTQSGTFDFTLRVSSSDGQSVSRQFSLVVEPLCRDLPGSNVIAFEDDALAAAVRIELGFGAGADVTCADALGLTILYALDSGVESLRGIQHFTNLEALYVRENTITDISPVSGLTELEILVAGSNSISDMSSLSGLTDRLWDLDIGENPVSDATALASLTGMTKLYLNATGVTDLGPLLGLVAMADLDLNDNPSLTNIDALIGNTGIDSGDQVHLENTGVSCADIDVLVARGVSVISDCP